MPALLLGPVLRHVTATTATVWIETDGPATVDIAGSTDHTWCVAGHHYALVLVEGLAAGSSTPYDVRLDGEVVWPPPGHPYPPPRIRTLDPTGRVRVIFGSCRYATPRSVQHAMDADALDTYAARMAGRPEQEWPTLLLLLGDQVYADETSAVTQEFIRARRDVSQPPGLDVADYEEYTRLYYESWSDPDIRWLLSTVPSAMIFDDHDVRDDWNTSHEWREEMQATDWWEERIVGGLSSYWVYQHLGNLSPAELAADDTYRAVRDATDGEALVREFARHADAEADGAKGTRWSYRRDLGRTRLLVIDSRCGRILADRQRSMISEDEFRWLEAQVDGDYDHLLIGTSLPWLMPRALHEVESWDEALAAGTRGARAARWAEKLRRAADLEHWAAFRLSFDRLARLIARVGRGEATQGRAPATVCVLSGDVHHAYVAQARYPQPVASSVYQLTCSPVHNHVQAYMHVGFRVGWSRAAERCVRALGRFAKVPPTPLEWDRLRGPYFGNELATLDLDGRRADLTLERSTHTDGADRLHEVARLPL